MEEAAHTDHLLVSSLLFKESNHVERGRVCRRENGEREAFSFCVRTDKSFFCEEEEHITSKGIDRPKLNNLQ